MRKGRPTLKMWAVQLHELGSTTGQKENVSWAQRSRLSSPSGGSAVTSCHAVLPMMVCMSLRREPKQTLSSSSCFYQEFDHSNARPKTPLPHLEGGVLMRTNRAHGHSAHQAHSKCLFKQHLSLQWLTL